jgi:hypothetical protein
MFGFGKQPESYATTASLYRDDGTLIAVFTSQAEHGWLADVCKGYYWSICSLEPGAKERTICYSPPTTDVEETTDGD